MIRRPSRLGRCARRCAHRRYAQYPLYTATIALCGGRAVGYYLNEDNGWSMELPELRRAIRDARKARPAPGFLSRGPVQMLSPFPPRIPISFLNFAPARLE